MSSGESLNDVEAVEVFKCFKGDLEEYPRFPQALGKILNFTPSGTFSGAILRVQPCDSTWLITTLTLTAAGVLTMDAFFFKKRTTGRVSILNDR